MRLLRVPTGAGRLALCRLRHAAGMLSRSTRDPRGWSCRWSWAGRHRQERLESGPTAHDAPVASPRCAGRWGLSSGHRRAAPGPVRAVTVEHANPVDRDGRPSSPHRAPSHGQAFDAGGAVRSGSAQSSTTTHWRFSPSDPGRWGIDDVVHVHPPRGWVPPSSAVVLVRGAHGLAQYEIAYAPAGAARRSGQCASGRYRSAWSSAWPGRTIVDVERVSAVLDRGAAPARPSMRGPDRGAGACRLDPAAVVPGGSWGHPALAGGLVRRPDARERGLRSRGANSMRHRWSARARHCPRPAGPLVLTP